MERATTASRSVERPTMEPPAVATVPDGMPGPMARWGPASWWRIGLVAMLGLMVLLLLLGGGFWQAAPVDAPR